jgi:DNA-binding transcriptional ArsR family regulator
MEGPMKMEKRKRSAMVAADVLGPLSHPTRLLIICLLLDKERNAGELLELLGSTKGNLSQHLKLLSLKRLVSGRREGNRVFYRIADARLRDLVKTIQGLWCPGLAVA